MTRADRCPVTDTMRPRTEKSDPSHYFSFPSLEQYEEQYEDADQHEAKREST